MYRCIRMISTLAFALCAVTAVSAQDAPDENANRRDAEGRARGREAVGLPSQSVDRVFKASSVGESW